MPPVGSDLLNRSLSDVAATTFGAAFLTGFFAGFAGAFLTGAATFGFTTGFGLVITFGLETTFGFTTTGLIVFGLYLTWYINHSLNIYYIKNLRDLNILKSFL